MTEGQQDIKHILSPTVYLIEYQKKKNGIYKPK